MPSLRVAFISDKSFDMRRIEGGVAARNGMMSQSTSNKRFPCTCGAGNNDMSSLFDPLIFRQRCDDATVKISIGVVFNMQRQQRFCILVWQP